jgi:hypothetical protein
MGGGGGNASKPIQSKAVAPAPAPVPVAAPTPGATLPKVTAFKTKRGTDKRRVFGSADTFADETVGGERLGSGV